MRYELGYEVWGTGHQARQLTSPLGLTVCTGALQPTAPGGSAVFGQVFLMAQFAVFNVRDRSISFADIVPGL